MERVRKRSEFYAKKAEIRGTCGAKGTGDTDHRMMCPRSRLHPPLDR